jgi:hypothetical protein
VVKNGKEFLNHFRHIKRLKCEIYFYQKDAFLLILGMGEWPLLLYFIQQPMSFVETLGIFFLRVHKHIKDILLNGAYIDRLLLL